MLDFALLNGGLGEERSAVELVELADPLEENVCNAAGALVPGACEECDLDIHDDYLWREEGEAFSGVVENNGLGFLHADVALGNEGLVFLGVFDVEGRVFQQLS